MREKNLEQTGKKSRILYFDALEVVAIFLVVSVHNVWLNGTVASSVAMALCPLAVPVFFMVHGALLLNKPFDMKRHLTRTGKTLLQLIIWMLIYYTISLCFGWNNEPVSVKSLYQYFIGGAVMNAGLGGSLWFMVALLQIYMIFPILHAIWISNKKVAHYAVILLFVFSFVCKEVEIWGTWLGNNVLGFPITLNWWKNKLSPFGGYANCIFFFLAGAVLAEQISEVCRRSQKAISLRRNIYIYIYCSNIAPTFRYPDYLAGTKAAIRHNCI